MSRRSSSSSRQCSSDQRSSDQRGPYETTAAVSPVTEQTTGPSLESLLASCGALQSALWQRDDADNATAADPTSEFKQDADWNAEQNAGCTAVAEGERTPNEADSAVESQADLSQQQPIDSGVVGIALPADVKSLINSLRHEFRASIDELKSAQSAAAASQSAVLKTLAEIIFQSASTRDGSGSGLEQMLSETEDRILNRINQVGGLAHVGDTKASAASTNAGSRASASVQNKATRSWAEIRDEFMVHGGVYDSPAEPVLQERDCTPEESASPEAVSADQECRLEVPHAVDAELLNEQELRTAFYEREAFILTLIGRLRHQHQRSSGHLPAEQLKSMAEHLPEDLAVQVLQTLQQLDERARIGELELSLERARLSRQLSQLDHSRQLIEHNARQLGLTLAADGTLSNPQKQAIRGSESRRWLSKLGFGQ